jgi:hypothetical protein
MGYTKIELNVYKYDVYNTNNSTNKDHMNVTMGTYAQFIIKRNGAWSNYINNDKGKIHGSESRPKSKHNMEPHHFN